MLAAGSGLLIYHDTQVRVMLVVLAGGLLLQTMTTRFEPVFLATVRFSAVAISDVAARVSTLAMVAWLVAARSDVIWFAVAQLIPPAVQLLIQGPPRCGTSRYGHCSPRGKPPTCYGKACR